MRMKQLTVFAVLICVLAVVFTLGSCTKGPAKLTEIASFKLNTLDGLLTTTDVSIDSTMSVDSVASLKITSRHSMTMRLFELLNIKFDNASIVYRATIRSKELSGRTYLYMAVHFPDGKEAFSRGFDQSLFGSTPWVPEQISYNLEKGKIPDRVTLCLVVEGSGTIWIDDIHVLKGPRTK